MTAQEKLRKAEQKNRRLEARLVAAEKRSKYLFGLCEQMEGRRQREVAAQRTNCHILTMLLERVAVHLGELRISTQDMAEEILGYNITFEALPQTHEIQMKAVKKEQA